MFRSKKGFRLIIILTIVIFQSLNMGKGMKENKSAVWQQSFSLMSAHFHFQAMQLLSGDIPYVMF